ncbi:MAG: MMPL family transporter [Verrucomicrobiota bacterium]
MKYDWFTRLYLWLMSHRKWVLLTTLFIGLASIALSTRLDLEEDILATLPENDPLVDEYRYALRKFKQIDRVYLDIGINADNPESLAQAADEFYAHLSTNSDYAKITYRLDAGGQLKIIDFLTGALPNLFTTEDAEALETKTQPGEIREFLTVMRRKLAGPEGMVLKEVVAADPVGMSGLVVNKVMPLQTGFGDAQIVDGRITSHDGRHILMLAEPKFPSANSRASEALIKNLLSVAHEVETKFPGVHIASTGGHRMSVDNASLIKKDAARCIFLGMAAMLLLCLTAFRRRWLALATFLPSLFGGMMALVVLALWQKHLSAIATGFAAIAIGITVDYAVYIIYQLDNAAGLNRAQVGQHVGRLVLPITAGALTTVAAFAVMATSPMHGYQQLGIFGAVGVLFSAAFALFILPLLVPIPKKSGQPPLWLTRFMEKFHGWQKKWRPALVLILLALTVASIFGIRKLRFEGDIAKMNGITKSTAFDDELIRNTWGNALNFTLVVARGATEEEALAKNDRAAGLLAREPGVSAVYSLSAVCPSSATQRQNIQRWKTFWTQNRKNTVRQNLQQIGGELGFRPAAFDKFWSKVESEPALLTLQTFRGTPLEQVLNERVALAPGDNAISTLLKVEDRAEIPRLRAALPEMIVLDHKSFGTYIAHLAQHSLAYFAFWTVLIVAIILFLTHPSIELVLAILVPLAVSLCWTFGLMGFLGLPIDMMNSIFVIFIIGVGEDYGVFLMTSKLDEWHGHPQRLAATSASVLISALTTLFGFAVLVFAKHPVLFSMGTTVLLGMGCAFFATLILTPLCMDLLLFKAPPRGAPRLWHLLGTIWIGLHLGGSELFLYYILRPLLHLFSPRTAKDKLRRATRWMARGVVKSFPYGKLEFQNISAETFAKPAIVISNHQSAVDVLLVVSLPADIRQTAKKRVFDTPILGIGCKLLGHVMVEPNDPETTLRRCREKLAEGVSVHFYPEGTRSHDGFLQRFHRGAFDLAIESRQEILPVVLCDTNTAMPRDSYWFEPYHVTVRALPRVTPENFDYSQGSPALLRHCEKIVRESLQKQLDEVNTTAVVRRKVDRLYRYQEPFVEKFVYWKLKLDPIFKSLDAVVPRAGFILDLGCGYGIMDHWLAAYTDERSILGVDYDGEKIRVAQRTALHHARIRFESHDILEWEYPPCDALLLIDVLHYWKPEKQLALLRNARKALRPGGKLILRDAARSESEAHRRVKFWEKIATRIGHNQTVEGLHFRTLDELTAMLQQAGFTDWELKREAGRDSNVLLVATVPEPQSSREPTR